MRRLAAILALLVLGASPTPRRTPPPPVFEIHRTAAASGLDPGPQNPLFVLVIGSDVRSGDPVAGRSDSLHIVALNTQSMQGTIVGIPRDSWVTIPGRGISKINDSLVAGGPARVVETVQSISGIPFQYWVLVDFSRFRELVDRLGGVDVNVPRKMADKDSGAFFDPGPRHMNGDEALAFARDRHDVPLGDLGRSEDQGILLLAALAKFRTDASDPFAVFRYLDAFRGLVQTNVPVRDLLHLAALLRHIDPGNIRNVVVPSHAGQVGPLSVVFLDLAAGPLFASVRDDGVL